MFLVYRHLAKKSEPVCAMHTTVLWSLERKVHMKNGFIDTSVRRHLRDYERMGVKLYINGRPSDTENIVRRCVMEDTVYMADYVFDQNGTVREIRFDRVLQK